MKRLFGIFLSVLFVFTLSFSLLTVQAEETEDVVLVYVEAPDGWESPCIWAWDDDGTGAYSNLGWPGKEMIADEDNEGWYYLYVPSTMTNVIVNANEGTIQTDAFALAGEDVWVTITSADSTDDNGDTVTTYTGTTSTVQATVGDLPEYVATKYVYAYVPIDWDTAGIWAWNFDSGVGVYTTWPGEEMTLLDDGWFMIEVPDTADRVIINNFDADNCEQTVDVTVGTEDVYIMLDDEANDDGQFEVTLYDEKPVIIEDGITLYVSVPEDWSAPCLWAWSDPDGTGLYTTWPGEEITYDEETGYFVVEVPTWVNRVIINNGSTGDDAAQTTDGTVPETEGDELYVTVGEADEDGKFAITISESTSTVDDTIDDTTDDSTETTSSNAIYYIVGGVVIALGVCGVVIFRKKAA